MGVITNLAVSISILSAFPWVRNTHHKYVLAISAASLDGFSHTPPAFSSGTIGSSAGECRLPDPVSRRPSYSHSSPEGLAFSRVGIRFLTLHIRSCGSLAHCAREPSRSGPVPTRSAPQSPSNLLLGRYDADCRVLFFLAWVFVVLGDSYDLDTHSWNPDGMHVIRQQDFWYTFGMTIL